MRTHFKPTETFQYTHFSSCHPPSVRKSFIKGEETLQKQNLKKTLLYSNRDYATEVTPITLQIKLSQKSISTKDCRRYKTNKKKRKNILPFFTEYRPSVPNLKTILMSKWHLIENHPLLREIYKDPPLLSYRKGRSLKDVLVRAKL